MCRHRAKAERLIAEYQDALVMLPHKRQEAMTAIFALRAVFGSSELDDPQKPQPGAACPLPLAGAQACAT